MNNSIYQFGDDNFMEFLFFILASVGMCYIIVDGVIFNPLKLWLSNLGWNKVVELSNCSLCCGFYCGLFMGFFLDPFSEVSFLLLRLFAYSCTSSLICYLGTIIMNYILINSSLEESDE